MESSGRAPEPGSDLEQRIDAFAQSLGEASCDALRDPARREAARTLISSGYALDDAVLKVLHTLIRKDRGVANEFMACFLLDLTNLGKYSMSSSSRLRRFLDTGDLVCSVIGDIWPDVSTLAFESRTQFVHLLGQRMGWKAADKARRLSTQSRREDKRVFVETDDLEQRESGESVAEQLIRDEERDKLFLVLLRLPERDRQLLALRMRGLEIQEIADELGLNYDAARKAISRALTKARKFMHGGRPATAPGRDAPI